MKMHSIASTRWLAVCLLFRCDGFSIDMNFISLSAVARVVVGLGLMEGKKTPGESLLFTFFA
jgi:hypothetical protein